MKAQVLLTLVLLMISAYSIELTRRRRRGSRSNTKTSPPFGSLSNFFDYSVGTWVGGGLIELTRPDEFITDKSIVEPNGFEELQPEDWTIPGTFARIYMTETI